MQVGSVTFFLLALAAIVFYRKTEFFNVNVKLAFINVVFLSFFFNSILSAVPVFVFSFVSYVFIFYMPKINRNISMILCVLSVVLLFSVIKRYEIYQGYIDIGFDYSVVGLSYILFRVIHLMVDYAGEDVDSKPSILQYFNYVFFFLSFSSGPIQRYEFFSADNISVSSPKNKEEVVKDLGRVVGGIIKVFIISVVAYQVFTFVPIPQIQNVNSFEAGIADALIYLAKFSLKSISFVVYLYFNFSGYMDIIIGVGGVFGFKLPENFNKPFSANNFLDFWSRWHITLSEWFRTYVFNPVLRLLASNFGREVPVVYLAPMAFFFTFFLMGIWHGTTQIYIVYGLLFGLGTSANALYQVVAAKCLGRKQYKSLTKQFLYKNFCRGLTVVFFTASLSCMWMNFNEFVSFSQYLGIRGGMVFFGASSVLFAIGLLVWDQVLLFFGRLKVDIGIVLQVTGLIWLILVWGQHDLTRSMVHSLIEVSLPASVLAILPAVLIVFGREVSCGGMKANQAFKGVGVLSVEVLLLLGALLVNSGAVPDYIYAGF